MATHRAHVDVVVLDDAILLFRFSPADQNGSRGDGPGLDLGWM